MKENRNMQPWWLVCVAVCKQNELENTWQGLFCCIFSTFNWKKAMWTSYLELPFRIKNIIIYRLSHLGLKCEGMWWKIVYPINQTN